MAGQSFDIEELKSDYLLSLEEDLSEVEGKIVELDKLDGKEFDDLIYEVFRKIHSLKGSSGSFEFYMLATIFHRLEDLINLRMNGQKVIGFIDLCFRYVDVVKNCINDYKIDSKELEKYTTIIEGLSIDDKKASGKLLLIEPTLSIRKMINKVALDNNMELTILNNGATALSRLIHERFDLIMTSSKIDAIDGESLLRGIRVMKNLNQKTPMVLISGDVPVDQETNQYDFILKDKDLITNTDTYIKNNVVVSDSQSEEKGFPFKNIVFVEDDLMIQTIIKKIFKDKENVELKLTGDFKSSMSAIVANKPDLLVLDYFLKDCVGTEILEQSFRRIGKLSMPILFMTSTPENVDLKKLQGWGNVMGIIEKPIKARSLLAEIKRLTSQK